MGFIVCIAIIFIIMILVSLSSHEQQEKHEEAMEPMLKRKDEYEEKLKFWCRTHNVIYNDDITESKEVYINKQPGYIWFSNKDIVFCPDAINCGETINIDNNIIHIKYENIKFFTKDGTVTYTNQMINKGKNISVSGAVIGGLIAGDAGAIIGSRKDANQFENVTVRHDDTQTYIYYGTNDDNIKVINIKGDNFYRSLLQLIPEKNYETVMHNMQNSSQQQYEENTDIKSKLKQLKVMYEEGLIVEDEYNSKKSELLNNL